MKKRKIPLRSCVVTKERLPKRDLIRVVRDKENNVLIDLTGKANGRGAYLKKDIEVINKAQKSKVLDKHLETKVPDEIFLELENIIK
jgi:predicted RNA-binding protein YlxR (DUF448 family)